MNISRALISVSKKNHLKNFASFLKDKNIEIVSTNGTRNYLQDVVDVTPISSISNYDTLLDGKVKSLHPKIIGSLLTDKPIPEYNIKPFQLLICNLYPFEDIYKMINDEEIIINNIDIGGHTMIRCGIKNYKNILTITNYNDYKYVMKNWDNIDINFLENMAFRANHYITSYDNSIGKYLASKI